MMTVKRLLASLLALGACALAAHSQVEGATYKGNRLCLVCHKKTNPEIVDSYQKTAHAKALQEPSDESIVADFANAPFPKDKVAWVLGQGCREQAFLDADLKVLPGLWKVKDKKWVEQAAVDGATECVGCHTTGFDPETKKWVQPGVSCESCHGPSSKHNTAKKEDRKSTIVNPKNLDAQHQAMACGQCHSKGRSKDGKLAYPHGYLPGQDLGAVFTDAKPTTAGRNQQLSELMQSPKHWNAGVVCEKCHDPHGNTAEEHQLRLPVNETCLQCHKDKVKSLDEHVAAKGKKAPAGATCATCHMPNGQHLFDKTLADG